MFLLHKMYWNDIKDSFKFGTQELNTNGYGNDDITYSLEFSNNNHYVIEFLDSESIKEFYDMVRCFYEHCVGNNK